MFYEFPEIKNLKQVEAAIRGRTEFKIYERDDFIVVNYHVNLIDTFPPVKTINSAIRRELRGIKFDRKTGGIIARPYHKFFNFNERPETQESEIDWNASFNILEKLDGSMVHPLMLQNQVVLCTKAGPTDISAQAQDYAENVKSDYMGFCQYMLNIETTPLFEWCSNQNRIVIDYPEDKLILTGMRYNKNGCYLPLHIMRLSASNYDIPVVKTWEGTFDGVNDFVDSIQGLEGEEGYVARWPFGHMIKFKNIWYLQLHKTKELMTFEKDIWRLILGNKTDDAKAFLEQKDKDRLDAFTTDLLNEISNKADELKWIVIAAKDNLNESKKRFAIEIVNGRKSIEKGPLFSIWDGKDPKETIEDLIWKNCNSGTRLEDVRPLVNDIRWNDY